MKTRCKNCGQIGYFAAHRGCKISDYPCDCGGKQELVSSFLGIWHNRSGQGFVIEGSNLIPCEKATQDYKAKIDAEKEANRQWWAKHQQL